MNKPTWSKHPLFKIANDVLVDLPTPSTIRGWWNFGSLLGICLVIQITTGLFLAIHYCPNIDIAFNRVCHICQDVNYGDYYEHSMQTELHYSSFVSIYTGRNLYYGSYNFIHARSVGVVILFLTIATAFIGYVLPWGQISFWGIFKKLTNNNMNTCTYAVNYMLL
jgi:ubiquinol-cytochrome c reductase cytochrome b subunit